MARRLGLGGLLISLMAVALVILAVSSTDAATPQTAQSLPRAPASLDVNATGLKIRPVSIEYTGDGTGLLTGARSIRSNQGIHWSSWTAATAFGTGDNQINDCIPSCAGGRYTAYPVRLEMWKPARRHGELVFTRLTLFYTAQPPKGEPAHYTFTDIYADGVWGFAPPGDDGYCTHTDGEPKAAGCADINALPPSP